MPRVTQEMLRIWAERNGLEIQYMYGKCKAVCIGNGETVIPLGTLCCLDQMHIDLYNQ